VTQRLCPRCHNVLQLADDGSLVYCGHCGAPQVRLSEEMREQAEQQAAAAAAASLDPDLPGGSRPQVERVSEPTAVVWPGAIQCAALAGVLAALLTLLAFPLPPVSLLGLLWSLVAPIVVLGIYAARFPRTHITAGFGFRVGLLSGLGIFLASITIHTVALVLARFAFHDGASIDGPLDQVFAQMRTSLVARSGSSDADVQYLINRLAIPEFRAGLLLAGASMMLAMYLAYSSLLGGLAGYMRSRRQTQP
jgi:uncharacterized Zn finger protein (UPF0148 family)